AKQINQMKMQQNKLTKRLIYWLKVNNGNHKYDCDVSDWYFRRVHIWFSRNRRGDYCVSSNINITATIWIRRIYRLCSLRSYSKPSLFQYIKWRSEERRIGKECSIGEEP